MPYAIRVRLYHGDVLEADTDPELPDDAPGAEVVQDLKASQRALVELCEAFHGPNVQLLGFGPDALDAYGARLKSLALMRSRFNYSQGYTVLVDTPEMRSATMWRAQVDIAVAQ